MPEHLTDEELERAFRDGLRRAAAEAPTRLRDGIPRMSESAQAPSRRRVVWLAAAAAAVVAVGVPLVLRGDGRLAAPPASGTSAPSSLTSSTPSVGPATSWRTESYGGVELTVPSTWGWGGTPVNPGLGPDVCEVRGATVSPDGTRDPNARMRLPFVGRPVLQSDACAMVAAADARPDVDAVWFGSPLQSGAEEGVRTVAVGGVQITVFTSNADLRDRILASVRAVGEADANGCPADGRRAPQTSTERAGTNPTGLVVCAYSNGALLFGATRDAEAARDYSDAARRRMGIDAVGEDPCPLPAEGEGVLVGMVFGDGPTRWDRFVWTCDHVALNLGAGMAKWDPDLVRPWSGPEAKAYLVGPGPGDSAPGLGDLVRGILG